MSDEGDDEDGYSEDLMGYGDTNAYQAPDAEEVAGACPPIQIWFRIYPEIDFAAEFDEPPSNVTT